MSATTTDAPTTDAVVIDDDSTVTDSSKLLKLAQSFVDVVQEIIPLDKSLATLYAKACKAKAATRRLVLVSDGDPDWTGATASYRSAVAEIMDVSAFKGCSAARLETVKNNLKSHMRRGILDAEIMDYVRTSKEGLDKVEKGKEKDSAAFRAAMRHQYGRAKVLKLANPIACPDHWSEPTESSGTGSDADAKSEDTAASALGKALVSVQELSVPEVLDNLHRVQSKTLTPCVEINAKVRGGKDAAAAVARRMAAQLIAAVTILEGKMDADAIEAARESFAKHAYQEDAS